MAQEMDLVYKERLEKVRAAGEALPLPDTPPS